MNEGPLKSKSYSFSVEIVFLVKQLREEHKEFILSKQIIRSGTAICALIMEAEYAQSSLDFINKLSIALKEANETLYWLNLLKDCNYISFDVFKEKQDKNEELIKMLTSSINTLKSKVNKKN
jgi:four helix bundle protein